jgi:hypothetical protein
MDKKLNEQRDPFDNQKNVNKVDDTSSLPDDSMFTEDDSDQNEEEELNFHNFENAEFAEELNQQEERFPEGDPLDNLDNPYLDDMEFEDTELDIPGADLDDTMEDIGSEDEENNYYSLGGDNHEDLEEQHFDEDL